jgi:hypothetical protein
MIRQVHFIVGDNATEGLSAGVKQRKNKNTLVVNLKGLSAVNRQP